MENDFWLAKNTILATLCIANYDVYCAQICTAF